MAFGKEIRRIRENSGLTIKAMAELLLVDPARYKNWEQRDSVPRYLDRSTIEHLFRCKLEDFSKIAIVPERILSGEAAKEIKEAGELGNNIIDVYEELKQSQAKAGLKEKIIELLETKVADQKKYISLLELQVQQLKQEIEKLKPKKI